MDNFLGKIVDNIPRFDIFALGGGDEEEYKFQEQMDEDQDDQGQTEFQREKSFDEELYIHHLKTKLIDLFRQDDGKKLLLLDRRLSQLFDMVVRAKRFNEQKANNFQQETGIQKMSALTIDSVAEEWCERIYFFIYPDFGLIQKITKKYQKKILLYHGSSNKFYSLVKTCWCNDLLNKQNIAIDKIKQYYFIFQKVQSSIVLKSFNFDLVPFGQDLYSLEIQNPLQEIYFEKEQGIFQLIADSLMRIQYLYGYTNNVFGIGNAAKAVEQVLSHKKRQNTIEDDAGESKTIESIVIIDRMSDLSTPLYTPVTYQALLDEQFGVSFNSINVNKQILTGEKAGLTLNTNVKEETVKEDKIFVNPTSDSIFAAVANKTLLVAKYYLNEKREELKELFHKFRYNNSQISKEEQEIVKKKISDDEFKKIDNRNKENTLLLTYLEQVQQYGRHFQFETSILLPVDPNDISEIVENLECLILFDYPLQEVLRLFCLLCQAQNGLKEKVFESICKLIIQQYGIQHLSTLNRLEYLGFLKKQKSSKDKDEWINISAKLRLINEQVDERNPDDITYVYIAYAPISQITYLISQILNYSQISVRLVEQTFQKGSWREIEKELKILGNYFMPKELKTSQTKKKKIVIVYYVGGVTYGEVAALRLLGEKYNKEIVICTTNIINSKTIFQAAMTGYSQQI